MMAICTFSSSGMILIEHIGVWHYDAYYKHVVHNYEEFLLKSSIYADLSIYATFFAYYCWSSVMNGVIWTWRTGNFYTGMFKISVRRKFSGIQFCYIFCGNGDKWRQVAAPLKECCRVWLGFKLKHVKKVITTGLLWNMPCFENSRGSDWVTKMSIEIFVVTQILDI